MKNVNKGNVLYFSDGSERPFLVLNNDEIGFIRITGYKDSNSGNVYSGDIYFTQRGGLRKWEARQCISDDHDFLYKINGNNYPIEVYPVGTHRLKSSFSPSAEDDRRIRKQIAITLVEFDDELSPIEDLPL